MSKYTVSDIFQGDYKISQLYGANPSYYKPYGLNGHEGVDWTTPTGVPIVCPFEQGRILRVAWDPVYGYHIVVWDPKQLCAIWFCHLSYYYVAVGQLVPRNFILGKTGNSGNSTGPHLHVNFCETDKLANRLNKNNGYQGFLNILDENLVEWDLFVDEPQTLEGKIRKVLYSNENNDVKISRLQIILPK
jgi:murein DD-endopeptidase MepM/ murein hydrolase activator NlpD